MTNGHSFDYEVERQVLQNPPCYVGAIGSQHKKEFVNGKLREAGIAESVIQQVHCPIGTAIRAVTPEEIAISIAGEMILECGKEKRAAIMDALCRKWRQSLEIFDRKNGRYISYNNRCTDRFLRLSR